MSDTTAFWLIVAGVTAVLLLPLWLTLRKASRSGSPLGVHLTAMSCPQCGAVQPLVRKPANLRQALWGGGTCKNCGTEMDKYGQVIGRQG